MTPGMRPLRPNPTPAQVDAFLRSIQPGAERMARLVAATARYDVLLTAEGDMGAVQCMVPDWVQAAIKQHHEHVQAMARTCGIA